MPDPVDDEIRRLRQIIGDKGEQGYDVAGLADDLAEVRDAAGLDEITERIASLPVVSGWPYREPNDLAGIRAESHPDRARGPLVDDEPSGAAERVAAGFLGSVCGCILGKPIEIDPTLEELRAASVRIGEWPIDDYISERLHTDGGLRPLHEHWPETVRERIRWVAADDDINYTLIGMLAIEQHGDAFTRQDLARLWLQNLPIGWTFGPERTMLLRFGEASRDDLLLESHDVGDFVLRENPGEELCGAMIRADAYGYACPGDPELASALAWRDASLTHRRTGIYGSMFFAAALACAFVLDDPLEIVSTALHYVPQRSRFHAAVVTCLHDVADASDWMDGYRRIHDRYGAYGHCRILQETGTLVNTLRFAESVGHGICIQVSQGNDTDSYGARAGALLGVRFGPGHLDPRWLSPFHDTIHTTVATLHEQSLSALAERVATLPGLRAASRPAPGP